MHAVHAVVEVLDSLVKVSIWLPRTYMRVQYTCAVLGGKNSKEKVGFPSALAWASFCEMCIVRGYKREEGGKTNCGNYRAGWF